MNLGEAIYRLRTEKNMSQGDLADALGVSRQSVSKWENGNATPDLDRLIKMAELFGVSLDELVGRETSAPVLQEASEAPVSRFSRRQKVGFAFWSFYVLIVLALALSGEGLSGMVAALPFLICGWFCYGTKLKHIVLWCTWVFALPAIAVPWYEYIRLTEARLIIAVLWSGMLVTTVWSLRKDPIPFTKPVKLLLITGYGIWFAWFAWTVFRFLQPDISPDPRIAVDTTISYWLNVLAYLLFTSLLSISTRLLKQLRRDPSSQNVK